MRRPLAISAVVLLLAGGAATAPSTQPTVPIAKWFDQLADADPAVRDSACEQLMGLPVDALPRLLAVVRAAGLLRPAQATVLRQIVTQVCLAADPYDLADSPDPFDPIDGPRYILGQSWPYGRRGTGNGLGVPVVNRWPGFPARRFLRDGDLILGLYNDPATPADHAPDTLTTTTGDLVQGMRDCPSRPRLAMAVLRDGRVIRVTTTMVPEPARTVGRHAAALAAFAIQRQRRADDYWDDHFASFVDLPDGAGVDRPLDSVDGPR